MLYVYKISNQSQINTFIRKEYPIYQQAPYADGNGWVYQPAPRVVVDPKNLDIGGGAWAAVRDVDATPLPLVPALSTKGQPTKITIIKLTNCFMQTSQRFGFFNIAQVTGELSRNSDMMIRRHCWVFAKFMISSFPLTSTSPSCTPTPWFSR